MRHCLTLETQLDAPDLGGGWDRRWVALGKHFASIQSASGQESAIGSQQAQRITHRITLRASPYGAQARPRADQRFRAGPRIFDIKAVFERDAMGRHLTCLVEEIGPAETQA
ncbi:MAG: head-tail adaptor protein [Neomegalonema sp.]|nr:head-tail adaptor protein [Neomegalonema sp.]